MSNPPRRTVDLATDLLRGRILSGELAPGDRLRPERELAAELGISRLTLRAATAKLESEGLLRARQGSGTTVLDYRTSGGVELLPALLESGRMELLGPFLQLRRAVAVEAVGTACVSASDADLDRLQVLADELMQADGPRLRDGNLEFGRRVVELAGNLPMLLLFNTVARVYDAQPELAEATLVDRDAIRVSFGAVVQLLRTRNAELAREAVRQTLEAIDAATLVRLQEEG